MEPTARIPLLIYISVVEEATPIYFIRRRKKVLEDREGGPRPYDRISKIAPLLPRALDNCKDRPANQADLAGWMVKWSIQLSKFDISYEGRGHIKAQALAGFIIEMTTDNPKIKEKSEWFLSVDEASNQTRSGARVILEGPNRVLIEQSLHFEFKTSNN
ncbi:hypothetical protein CR513_36466, partial [Mucuna pruriens]